MKKFLSHKILWTVITAVFAVLFAVFLIAYFVTAQFSAAINMALGTSNFKTVNDPNATDKVEFKTDYDEWDGETIWQEDRAIIKDTVAEGVTMLWNKQNALPLAKGNNVSLLGCASANLLECGSGSGYVVTQGAKKTTHTATDLKTALTDDEVNLKVNESLWNFYTTGAARNYRKTNPETACTEWRQWDINEAPWSVYTDAVKGTFSQYGDAAIIVLSRMGGEYSDLHYSYTGASDFTGANDNGKGENTSANGGYLGLSDQEDELIENVINYKKNNTFKKVIVLLNTANPIQMQDLDKYSDNIDACLWIGQVGSTGAEAVADILVGNTNPSGHLTDTYAYDLNSAPATVNDGNYRYENYSLVNTNDKDRDNRYMVYQEGIYVGYRYYETRYADLVAGNGNADSSKGVKHSKNGWDYNQEVAFPFGYGLSYTTFEYSNFKVSKSGGNYEVSVTVTNTGDYAGKEAVQIYLQKPYTQYDKDNNIEKAAIELAGIAKTGLLAAKTGKETVKVTVPEEYFKTYDANNAETYIIEEGDYYLAVGTDAHVALNNVLALSNPSAQTSQSVMCGNAKDEVMGKEFAHKISLKKDNTTYAKSRQTGEIITNQLDSGDINKYANRGDNSVTYLSRNDWNATYPTSAAVLTLNAKMAQDLRYDNDPDDTGYESPKYGVFASGSTNGKPDPENGDLVAFNFIEAPLNEYDEKWSKEWEDMWNQLLDQMTFAEQALMCANAYHQLNGAESISLIASKQENGPVGITKRSESSMAIPNKEHEQDWTFVSYPCAPLVGATFNLELAEEVGKHMSEDMFYLGYNGIYGPGANMHRSPYGGRAFEYASEDSFLTGIIAAYESIGIESKGCLAYVKHYALNDQETNRRHVGVWSNEQATREIYLRPFEIAFTDGGASATMNSFSRVGTRWNGGCKAMMTDILRVEWGWDGINITDWMTNNAMSYVDAMLAGTNSFDGNGNGNSFDKWKDSTAVQNALRESAKVIIYNVVKTNAMNGASLTTRVVKVTPWWQQALIAGSAVCGGLFGLSAIVCAGCWTYVMLEKKKGNGGADNNGSNNGNVTANDQNA